MVDRERENRSRGADQDPARGYTDPGREHGEPREDLFGRGFDPPEPGEPIELAHEPRYSQPYDRWRPRDYVFYAGEGYHREFVEPYKTPQTGRYRGRGPKNYVRSDERIREDVNERLTDDPDVDASDIQVRVENGDVTLEGIVEDSRSKRRAEDVAYAVRGVGDVHNRLRAKRSS